MAQKIARKSAPVPKGMVIKEESEEELHDEDLELEPEKVNTDQFSLRFDDQEKC